MSRQGGIDLDLEKKAKCGTLNAVKLRNIRYLW